MTFFTGTTITTNSLTSSMARGLRNIKLLHFLSAALLTLCLSGCGEEDVRTETAYLDTAYEAHTSGDSRKALFELATAIRHYPNSAELQLARGKIFLDIEDGAAAEISFNKAISLGYNADFLKHNIAESWLYQRKPGKIIRALEPEIAQGSKNALLLEILGRAYIAARDRTNPTLFMENMNKAELYINEAYRLNPDNTRVLITKAWLTAMEGKLDEAITWLDKADIIVKDQRQNLSVKGEIYIRQNKLDEANKTYSRLIEKFPQYPQYKLELGYTYLLQGDLKTAHKWVAPIVQQYPEHIRAKNLLANISLMQNKYETAKDLSDSVLAISSNDLAATLVNGASSFFLGDLENAHQKLSSFYNRTGSIQSLKLLAATKLKLGDNEAAAKLLADAGQTVSNPTDGELLNLVALASAKIGKVDVALEAYQKLAAQKPEETSYQRNTALLQISQGNFEEGFKNLEEALKNETTPKEPGQDLYILSNKALQSRQYKRAVSYINRFKEVAPENYKAWTMSAVLNSIMKKTDEVHTDFKHAIELAPEVAEVRARYAIFEKMQGNDAKAEDLAHQALALDPSDIGSGKLLLDSLFERKNYSEAAAIVETAVSHKNASPTSKLLFADYFTALGRPQDTLNTLNTLPLVYQNMAAYHIIASKAYLRSGQADRAVELLEKFLIKSPNNVMAMKHLLQGYLLTRNQAKYQATLEKLDRLQPNDYANQLELAKIYISTGKHAKAEQILTTLKPANEEQNLEVFILQSGLETNRKNYKKALNILAPLNSQYPQNGMVSMLYARNLVNDGQLDKAIAVSEGWASQHENNAEVKQFLGDLYLRKNDHAKAMNLYQSILTLTDDDALQLHANNNLAIIYLAKNDAKQALEHAQKAFDMAPNNPAVVDTYAQVLMIQGQSEKALDHFNQALALLPTTDLRNRSTFTLGKAKALIKLEQKDQAKNILQRLKKEDPDFPGMDEVQKILSSL